MVGEDQAMAVDDPNTEDLLQRAASGDAAAADELLMRHRGRLKQMVAVRMDPGVTARIDPSDVVQEAMIEATRKLPDYLRRQPIPFYPWLRQIAWERLVHLHERHIRAQKRSVRREERWDQALPDHSVMQLAGRLVSSGTSPSGRAIRSELRQRVRATLNRMAAHDREVLVMWYLEQLSAEEIAAILQMTVSGVKSRHRRALERLTVALRSEMGET